ncbi:aminoglycoside 6-adenylyltransferase [Niabella ginsengisoli]|uniref:Aminoglycoside 6-adenylyltransferase n=1 Tax=Niabella ginsengisoli TaxID=522298 RepID=A0ABS9SK25_9BACT|nr:aminoglycoside 6-adenylyltransferase [Niabella ginsengisoli]MCH5598660.1 aminoglycoside 6-adenylyltransferase [Niabella ginsengisoli]
MINQNDIQNKILNLAKADDRIRAVILNGSRANPNVNPDKYQDFDIVFIVKDFDSFLTDRSWINVLGKPILQQLPDEMDLGKNANEETLSFGFLMIFEDENRIDLTLFLYEKFETHFEIDSLAIVWLDKDNLFKNISKPSDKDYHITEPNQQEFSEVCNEFWWTITNVAKGLKREEIIYAKDMMENVVRPMFWRLIEWNIGSENDFGISVGKSGKFAKNFITESLYKNILRTYSDSNIENNWNSLLLMVEIFNKKQKKLANKLNFQIDTIEAENSTKYIQKIRLE